MTVCIKDRKRLLGEVLNGEMKLSPEGEIVREVWLGLPRHYPNLELDSFIVMPDHIHGVLILTDLDTRHDKGEGLNPSPTIKRHALPEIVRGFKALSTRSINCRANTPETAVWQRSFYDHVIRNPQDLDDIRKYISENPLRWVMAENSRD